LHFIHMIPDEIERHKLDQGRDVGKLAEERHQVELDLSADADYAVAVGPRIHSWFLRDLQARGVNTSRILRFDPGFDAEPTESRKPPEGAPWMVLLFGRAEDDRLKGLDLAALGFSTTAKRRSTFLPRIELVIRGAQEGTSQTLERQMVEWADNRALNVRVKPYATQSDRLASDLRAASLVLMPSRAEGFGLVGVEAIIARTPVLVSSASGLGELLRQVLLPHEAARNVVETTGDDTMAADEWSRAIEAILRDRDGAFAWAEQLQGRLAVTRTWAGSISELLAAIDLPNESTASTIKPLYGPVDGTIPAPLDPPVARRSDSALLQQELPRLIVDSAVEKELVANRDARSMTSDLIDPDPRNVFVVHGRNDQLRRAMFDFLRAIGLSPIEWSTAISMTGTAAPYIGDVLDAAFTRATAVVVLLTPDEVAYLQPTYGSSPDDPETQPAQQARPNVLFEAGMALGRHPRHTILVEIGEMRPFSDITGRHAIRLTNDLAKRQELATRLATAGCQVNVTGTDWHMAGDFTAPPPPGQGLTLGRRVPSTRSAHLLNFDASYHDSGSSSRAGRLQIINRGTETAYNVKVDIPEDAALTIRDQNQGNIEKIPGGGKAVSLMVFNANRSFGGPTLRNSFDLTITARTESGQEFSQEVFLDTN
jgi:predicted nucleotide-binding protein